MIDATLTVTISRTSLSLPDLVLSGSEDGSTLGLASYEPAGLQSRVVYAPDAEGVHGSEPLATSWQQAILGFDFFRVGATSEAQAQAAFLEVAAAVGQFSYAVTTQVSDAPAQVWSANAGSCVPSPRTYVDLTHVTPVFAVTIPVYPIPA